MHTLNLMTVFIQNWKKQWGVSILVGIAMLGFILSIIVPLFFLLYMNYDERVDGPAAEKIRDEMEAEFQKISPLPRAVQVQHGSMHKARQGLIRMAYKTELSYSEIKAYYDNELGKQGWRFARESHVKYDGQDYGGKELFYCKGNYTTNLYYAGRQEKEFGWTYSFTLAWPPSDECK